jgi:integrase
MRWATKLEQQQTDELLADLTVARLVMGWHDQRLPSLRDTSTAREASMLTKHILKDPIALMDARLVTRHDAAAYMQRLNARANGRGDTLAPKTRRHIAKAIRHAFQANLEVEVNPFQRVPLPSLNDVEMSFLTRTEIVTLLASVDLGRWGWVYVVVTLTGLRRSEFAGLKWECVDLEAGTIEVKWRRSTAGADVVEGQVKTRRARRRVPLDPLAISLLRTRRAAQEQDHRMWGTDWCQGGEKYVWTFEDGSLPHPDRLTSDFAKFSQHIGITNTGIHGLRHSFAAAAIAAGVAPYSLSRALGHTQVGFTMSTYGHLWTDGLDEEMSKISRMLGTQSHTESRAAT